MIDITNINHGFNKFRRAIRISENVSIDYITKRHVAFTVFDDIKKTIHSVLYKSEEKPPYDWSCDCKWFSTRGVSTGVYCAHIIAVNIKLSQDKQMLRYIEKI
ncbi:MAG: SWIM zinc finger family protein [Candidatus Parvarchaeota archaeon]|nr:SWIM zinc finger family protein [Candidatus Jingweiarchaeum tengchongense]